MKRIFLDSCISTDDMQPTGVDEFCTWSRTLLGKIRDSVETKGLISPIVFSEFSAGYNTTREVVAQVEALELTIQQTIMVCLQRPSREPKLVFSLIS